jgi:hypothetical protein
MSRKVIGRDGPAAGVCAAAMGAAKPRMAVATTALNAVRTDRTGELTMGPSGIGCGAGLVHGQPSRIVEIVE